MSPYRDIAKPPIQRPPKPWRVRREDPDNPFLDGEGITYHRFFWTAWLAAKLYVIGHSWAIANVEHYDPGGAGGKGAEGGSDGEPGRGMEGGAGGKPKGF